MFAFLAVAALVIVVPGQDTALTIRNTLGGGRRAGIATACGVACGLATWAVATAFGLAAILVASEPVYLALKAFGAAYLLWLGACCVWRATRRKRRRRSRQDPRACLRALLSARGSSRISATRRSPCSSRASCRSSRQPDATFLTALALGLLFCLLTLAWLAGYAASSHAQRTSSTGHAPAARWMPSQAPCSSPSG